jgi:dihydroorotase
LPSPGLAEGARADLVMIEPERSFVIEPARLRSKSHNTPFLGRKVEGAIALTMREGDIIFEATEEA